MNEADRFLARCHFRDDGRLSAHPDDLWRVGVLAFVRHSDDVLLVRKAQSGPDDYAFRAMWAMPGGIVRPAAPQCPVEEAVAASLSDRLSAEASVSVSQLRDDGFSARLGPVMTSYSRNGEIKHTLIVVREFTMPERPAIAARDPSIDEVQWIRVPADLASCAPANRLALGHLLWDRLTLKQQEEAYTPLAQALACCNRWASEAGVAGAVPPWGDMQELARWRESFP